MKSRNMAYQLGYEEGCEWAKTAPKKEHVPTSFITDLATQNSLNIEDFALFCNGFETGYRAYCKCW